MKVAIVHDWLVTYAGAERVLEEIINCFPDADLCHCRLYSQNERRFLKDTRKTSSYKSFPCEEKVSNLFALHALAVEQLDLSGYDIAISSPHAVAKGVITGPDQLHISYVHSPMRYAWDLQHQYLKESGLDRGTKDG